MNKPIPTKRKDIFIFHDMMDYIEKKYNFDMHDYAKKYSDKTAQDNPYLNYWHWLIGNCFYELSNGCERYWNILEILEGDPGYEHDTPDWVKEITQMVYDEFKDDLDKDGGIEVYISW